MKTFKKFLAVLLVLAALLPSSLALTAGAAGALPFEDIPKKAWYRGDVEAAYDLGLVEGVTDVTFEPNGRMTLAEAATLAARMKQSSEGGVTLEDGKGRSWYAPYVEYCKANGIFGDEYDGRWNSDATRTEMAKIFYNVFDPSAYTAVNTVEDGAIPDVKMTADGAEEIYALYRAGVLEGDESDGHKFKPKDAIKRSEVAAIVNHIMNPSARTEFTLTAVKLPPVPAYDAPLTAENVLALLDNYDPDGAFILRTSTPESYLSWWSFSKTIADGVGTAVHETYHEYSYTKWGWTLQDIVYLGDGETMLVPYTDVFDSAEAAATIPSNLRTFRFDTYVSESANSNMASRQFGVYGLLNEFTAYCWGTNTGLRLRDYCVANGNRSYYNDYLAHAEFRYYILHYMLYAKEHYPDVYQGILDNDAFRKAFTAIDTKFADVVDELLAKLRSEGAYSIMALDDYNALMAELDKPEYQEILKLLQP